MWLNAALALGAVAIIAGWFALVTQSAHAKLLRKWKRRAERTHEFHNQMRRASRALKS